MGQNEIEKDKREKKREMQPTQLPRETWSHIPNGMHRSSSYPCSPSHIPQNRRRSAEKRVCVAIGIGIQSSGTA